DHSARPAAPQQEFDLAPAPDAAETGVLAELSQIDPDGLSPRDALSVLFSLKEQLKTRR
ncbi:MAG: mismatch repair protein MutS, partial [Pseudomonadota bacterium]|nr:mismatch repair protein MutS [Pseudomonadota bacterium]